MGSSSGLRVSELYIKGFSSCFAHSMSLVCMKVCHWKVGDFGQELVLTRKDECSL